MIFDLSENEHRLTLSLFARENADAEANWRIEARVSRSAQATVVTGWGVDRLAALSSLGVAWREQEALLGLPSFDWGAIAELLRTVRGV